MFWSWAAGLRGGESMARWSMGRESHVEMPGRS